MTFVLLIAAAVAAAQSPQAPQREAPRPPGFELVLARPDGTLGNQLVRSDTDCEQEAARFSSGGPVCMMLATRSFINGDSRTMAQLATLLESYVKAPVVDRTGLDGAFHMTVRWSTGEAASGPPESATPAEVSAMLAALQAQLGLELEPARAPAAK